jgi:hypothetical protein
MIKHIYSMFKQQKIIRLHFYIKLQPFILNKIIYKDKINITIFLLLS